jgi:ketosteroid isomerase-like protein
MKRIAFAVCVAVFLFAIGAQAQAPAQTEVEKATQELIKIEKGWSEAYVKKDIAFLDQTLADDYMETNEEGYITTKAEGLENLKSGAFVAISSVQENVKVRVYGDAAVVTGRSTLKAQYKGKDASGQFQWTDTFIKRDGRWQCVAEHYSKIPQK